MAVPSAPYIETTDVATPISRAGQGISASAAGIGKGMRELSSDMMVNRSARYKAKLENELGTLQEENRAKEKGIDQAATVRETESSTAKRERLAQIVAETTAIDPAVKGPLAAYVSKLTNTEATSVLEGVAALDNSINWRRKMGFASTYVDETDGEGPLLMKALMEPGFATMIKERDAKLEKDVVSGVVNDIFSKMGIPEGTALSPDVHMKFNKMLAKRVLDAKDNSEQSMLGLVQQYAADPDKLATVLSKAYPEQKSAPGVSLSLSMGQQEKENFMDQYKMLQSETSALREAARKSIESTGEWTSDAQAYDDNISKLALAQVLGPKVDPITIINKKFEFEGELKKASAASTGSGDVSVSPEAYRYFEIKSKQGMGSEFEDVQEMFKALQLLGPRFKHGAPTSPEPLKKDSKRVQRLQVKG